MTISFDELIQKAKDVALAAGKVAGDVVGEVVDTSKAKLAEARLTSEIKEITERLGSIVYEAAKTGRDSIKLQEMLITELDNLHKSLEELRKRSAAAASASVELICAQCGEHNAVSAVFCAKCGTKLITEEPADYAVETEIPDTEETAEEVAEQVSAAVEAAAETVEQVVESIAKEVEDAAEGLEKLVDDIEEKL